VFVYVHYQERIHTRMNILHCLYLH